MSTPADDQRGAMLEDASRVLLNERGNPATLVESDDNPAHALAQAARDEDSQLTVVGHTGSGYVTRALLGSTAENVLRHAPCDVLVVR